MTTSTAVATSHLFDLVAELEQRIDLGAGPLGRRFFDRVRTGTFTGPRLRGEVLSGSGDPLLRRADGTSVIDARALLRTDDGAHILMTYTGRAVIPADILPALSDPATRAGLDPSRYYIRTVPVFETGAPDYQWLNGIVAVGLGFVTAGGGIGYRVHAVD